MWTKHTNDDDQLGELLIYGWIAALLFAIVGYGLIFLWRVLL